MEGTADSAGLTPHAGQNPPAAAHHAPDGTADAAVRTLVLLRHAKSAYPPGVGDFDRPLADRGEREAALAGAWLRRTQPPIDAVLCSAAMRTRLTLAGTGVEAPTTFRRQIYGAWPSAVLDEIRQVPDSVRTLLVVGHAPGLPMLAEELAGPASDPGAVAALEERFPTSTMAVLQHSGSWAQLQPGAAALVAFEIARGHHRAAD